MTGIIFRVSYDKQGQKNYECENMVCCFFVTKEIIATNYIGFNKKNFVTKKPFKFTDFFIIIDDYVINLSDEELFEFPDKSLTLIKLKRPYDAEIHKLSEEFDQSDVLVSNDSFKPGLNPFPQLVFRNNKIVILSDSLDKFHVEKKGYVIDVRTITIDTDNIPDDPTGKQIIPRFKDAKSLILSFGGVLNGMHGSPVFNVTTNEIIGMLYWGKEDVPNKRIVDFWALSSVEIIKCLKKAGLKEKSKKNISFIEWLRGLFNKS
jgi:hypothetical protein